MFSTNQKTTMRLFNSTLKTLTKRPDIQQLLRHEQYHIPNFIEKTLLIESPIKSDFQLSLVPSTVSNVDIPTNTILIVLNNATNRDPKQFNNPNTLNPLHPNTQRHIAFKREKQSYPNAPLTRARH